MGDLIQTIRTTAKRVREPNEYQSMYKTERRKSMKKSIRRKAEHDTLMSINKDKRLKSILEKLK